MPKEFIVVRCARGDLPIGLARPQELADIRILGFAAEETLGNRLAIIADVAKVFAAHKVSARQRTLELGLCRGAEATFFRNRERQVSNWDRRHAAPALVGDIHPFCRKSNRKRDDLVRIRHRPQFNGRVGDARLARCAARHGVVAEDDALDCASTGILRPRDTCGGIEFHVASGREDKMNRIEKRRLAGSVVAQQKEMPALGNVNGRGAKIVKLHKANGRDAVVFRNFHSATSCSVFADSTEPEIGSASCAA